MAAATRLKPGQTPDDDSGACEPMLSREFHRPPQHMIASLGCFLLGKSTTAAPVPKPTRSSMAHVGDADSHL